MACKMLPNLFTLQSRFIHFSRNALQQTVNKTHLASLRKKTGHSLSNCKKALSETNMDLEKAIKWLENEAKKQGWEKAIKLQSRAANQGLVGIHVDGNTAALIEVSCETDFVARNEVFKELVKNMAKTCVSQLSENLNIQNGQIIKQSISATQMGQLTHNNTPMIDQVALAISHLGENIKLRRGLLVKSDKDISLAGAVHPEAQKSHFTSIGNYAVLLAMKSEETLNPDVAHQLCMQIIGMNPQVINRPDTPKEEIVEEIEKPEVKAIKTDVNQEAFEPVAREKSEISLLHQDFIYNDDITVKDVVKENKIEIIDFVRFERGEESEALAQP